MAPFTFLQIVAGLVIVVCAANHKLRKDSLTSRQQYSWGLAAAIAAFVFLALPGVAWSFSPTSELTGTVLEVFEKTGRGNSKSAVLLLDSGERVDGPRPHDARVLALTGHTVRVVRRDWDHGSNEIHCATAACGYHWKGGYSELVMVTNVLAVLAAGIAIYVAVKRAAS